MKIFKLGLVLVVALSLAYPVYAKGIVDAKEAKKAKAAPVVMKQEKKSGQDAVAIINDKKITLDELNKRWNEIPEQNRYGLTKDKLLDGLIQEELIAQESLKAGIDKTEGYKKSLEDIKRQLLVREYLNKEVVNKVKVTEADVKSYYETHKNEYVEPERMKAKHILVKTEEEAKQIAEALKKNKDDFDKIAKEKSLDTASGKAGGDLGNFGRGEMVPEFENVAFALKEGEISAPVKTNFGYHIILAGARTPSKQKELSEVKDQVDRTLLRLKQREAFDKLIAEIKNKSKITENRSLIKEPENKNTK